MAVPYQRPTVTFKTYVPGVNNPSFASGAPSYLDLNYLSSSNPTAYTPGWHDSWCADREVTIINGATYNNAKVYSTYEYAALRANPAFHATLGTFGSGLHLPSTPAVPTTPGDQPYLENLDIVNWLLNNATPTGGKYLGVINNQFYFNIDYYVVQGLYDPVAPANLLKLTYGEIQEAIWWLLGDAWSDNVYLGNAINPEHVQKLVEYSIPRGEGFVPNTDGVVSQKIAYLLDVRTNAGAYRQAQLVLTNVAKLGDYVWNDSNANGIQNAGETGIDGVRVNLWRDVDGDGVFGGIASNEFLATTVTGDNPYLAGTQAGYYEFKGLTPGLEYQVEFVKPSGYAVSPRQVTTPGATPANNSDGLVSDKIVLLPGEFNSTIDAGFYVPVLGIEALAVSPALDTPVTDTKQALPATASLASRVWCDSNGNGIQDSGEAGVAGVTVKLLDSNGSVLGATTTDSHGDYVFDQLQAASYQLRVVKPAAFAGFTTANQGNDDGLDSDVDSAGLSSRIVLVAGQKDSSVNAGLTPPAGRSVTPIAIDLDGDGVETVALAASTGRFDLFGNGVKVNSGWLAKDDAFLAIDSNHNGRIDSINELFGGKPGEGFAELIAFDSNGDLVVNASDAHFRDLLVWRDTNGNHRTDSGELMSLAGAGVVSLSVDTHADSAFWDAQGNLHLEQSHATLASGQVVDLTDLNFATAANDAAGTAALSPLSSGLMFA